MTAYTLRIMIVDVFEVMLAGDALQHVCKFGK